MFNVKMPFLFQWMQFNTKKNKTKKKKQPIEFVVLVWFGLVKFYGILTIIGYLMPNPLYKYIKHMICKHILLITFLNEPNFILLQTVKWFQVLLCITDWPSG